MSLSFLPSTVGFFLSHPGGKQPNRRNSPFSSLRSIGDATYCRRLYSCLPEVYWKVFGRTLGKIWRCLGTFSLKKIARSTRGASTAGIWSSQFPIIPPNRERIPLDLPGGEILDGGLHDPRGRKESFVESPSLPRNPSHRSKFRINYPLAVVSEFVSVILILRTRPHPFHAILADNSTVRSRDDHPRFPAPTRYPRPSLLLTNRSVLSSQRVDVVSVAACCVAN